MFRSFRSVFWGPALAFAVCGFIYGTWASRLPAIRDNHDLSHSALSLVLLSIALGAMASFPVSGYLSGKKDAKLLTLIFGVAYSALLPFLAIAPSIITLVTFAVLMGFLGGAMDVVMNAWGAEAENASGRPIMSRLHAMFSVGTGAGAGLGIIGAQYSVTPHFLTMAGLAILIAIISNKIPGSVSVQPAAQEKARPSLSIPSISIMLVGGISFATMLAEGAMADWSAIYLVDVGGFSESIAPVSYAAFSLSMIFIRLVSDELRKKYSPDLITRVGAGVSVVGIVLITTSSALPLIVFGFALVGMGFAPIVPLTFARAAEETNVPTGQSIATMAAFGYAGILIGPVFVGFIADLFSLQTAFGLMAVLAFYALIFASRMKTQKSQKYRTTDGQAADVSSQ